MYDVLVVFQGPTRYQCSKPVIAAVEGYAVAGGMELALWCDMRVMDETAVMGIFCRRFGKLSVWLAKLSEGKLSDTHRLKNFEQDESVHSKYTRGLIDRPGLLGIIMNFEIHLHKLQYV